MNSTSTNITLIPLAFWNCFFLNSSPDGNISTISQNVRISCKMEGKFLAGNGPEGEYYGRIICYLICILIYLAGTFGLVTNAFNIWLLRKSLKGASSLKDLLMIMTIPDGLACAFAMVFCTVTLVMLDNIDRSVTLMYMMYISNLLYSLGRSGAIYISLLITIERYLVIAFPIKSRKWLTPKRSKCHLIFLLFLVILLDLPLLLNTKIVKNDLVSSLPPNSSLATFEYIFKKTTFADMVHPWVRMPLLILNYVAPFPLLLLLNGLLYHSIHNWNKNRKSLSGRQKKEIGAARMFSVVVIILLLCHSLACVLFFLAQYQKVVHRELLLLQLFCVTLSAAVNFVVYYAFGKSFRIEFRKMVASWTARCRRRTRNDTDTPETAAAGTSSEFVDNSSSL